MDTSQDPFEHILPTVHEAVRKSQLLIAFHEKLGSLPAGAFPFSAEFQKLRDLIAPQIGDTRILFPEFTPHDEPLHVAKLFQLSDKLFGARIYKELNAAELFLLAGALYAHDWGMAVGQDEKEYLRHGAAKAYFHGTFTPLSDEEDRLNAFVRRHGLQHGSEAGVSELSDDYLRLYVRETHARRSGARARAHFVEHPAVGEALARICEGHWHEFATLDDPDRFPREYEAAGETANLLALTLQVRLIDLLHITDDRTPFALWRFVSPSDKRSAEEWKKHRALHGITVLDFHPGRAVKVQGFTEDEEVWASLQDLCRYCEDQIRSSLDVCARHVPQRYGLDFLKLEWAVPTGNLRPVNLRFEFERAAMFRILSDDIYDGDRYVFLRELLQNAIDAIRTRRGRHLQTAKSAARRKQTIPTFDTTIYFNAEHLPNGDILISCRDYGIGMDEHVIRSYFAVAGVSYYHSPEFERQHLGFEPISRFGIGILSCFMVADRLQVKTFRDPECGPPMAHADSQLPGADEHRARRLSVQVPGVQRQFIVKDLIEDFEVGTEVRLRVLAEKVHGQAAESDVYIEAALPMVSAQNTLFQRTLEITEYLTDIAGFVEFPILVEESWPGQQTARRTLILHPDRDPIVESSQFDLEVEVHQLSRSYPWEIVADTTTLSGAKELLTEHKFELSELLGDEGYEGWIVFPKPDNESWDFGERASRFDYRFRYGQIICRDRSTGTFAAPPLEWLIDRYKAPSGRRWSKTSLFSAYRDGILLPNLKEPQIRRLSRSLPPPLLRVNLPSSGGPVTNVARTSLKAKNVAWDDIIWTAVERSMSLQLSPVLALPAAERFFRVGWIATVFRVPSESLLKLIPESKLLTVWFVPDNKLELREGGLAIGNEIPILPIELDPLVDRVAAESFCRLTLPEDCKIRWNGAPSLVGRLDPYFSSPLQAAGDLASLVAWERIGTARLQFLEPPNGAADLLPQFVAVAHEPVKIRHGDAYLPNEDDESLRTKEIMRLREPDLSAALDIAVATPRLFSPRQRFLLAKYLPTNDPQLLPVSFSPPFLECWTTTSGFVNILHPFGEALFRCLAACIVAERDGSGPRNLRRCMHNVAGEIAYDESRESTPHGFANKIFALVVKHGLIDGFVVPSVPAENEVVPDIAGTTTFKAEWGRWRREYPSTFSGRCGALITKWPLPERESGDKRSNSPS